MDSQILQDRFIEKIREKMPNRSQMSSSLAEVLMIEKEAVYRRLRREVPFTFSEVCKVSQVLGISLDDIVGGLTTEKSRPFQLKLTEYYDPEEIDYIMMEQYVNVLELMTEEPYSEVNYSGNQIPSLLWTPYKKINRLHVFYWKYQYDTSGQPISYKDVQFSDRYWSFCLRQSEAIKQFKSVSFIWDRNLFVTLVDEIKFFHSINLITSEEKRELKEEVLQFIDDMEMLAARGMWEGTDNKVYFYVSNIHFDTNYTCFENESYYLSLINTFTLNSVASLEKGTFEKMKSWINSSKRVSTLISRSGEMQRILFFAKQREIINNL